MALSITPLYAAPLALLYVFLAFRVGARRKAVGLPLGLGEDAELLRRVRVHANFGEYVPFALLALVMAELNGAPALALHALGLGLLVGRCAHAWGVSQPVENLAFRGLGMLLSIAALVIGAAMALFG